MSSLRNCESNPESPSAKSNSHSECRPNNTHVHRGLARVPPRQHFYPTLPAAPCSVDGILRQMATIVPRTGRTGGDQSFDLRPIVCERGPTSGPTTTLAQPQLLPIGTATKYLGCQRTTQTVAFGQGWSRSSWWGEKCGCDSKGTGKRATICAARGTDRAKAQGKLHAIIPREYWEPCLDVGASVLQRVLGRWWRCTACLSRKTGKQGTCTAPPPPHLPHHGRLVHDKNHRHHF